MEKEMAKLIGDLIICLTARVCSRSGLLIESLKLEHNKNTESFVEVQLKNLNIKSDE